MPPSLTAPPLHTDPTHPQGTYAKVKYGQHAVTGQAVAIKILEKETLIKRGMVDQIKQEIAILKTINHPNIVNLHQVLSSKDKIFMIMELVTGGELFDKISVEGPMSEVPARVLFSQLLDNKRFANSSITF